MDGTLYSNAAMVLTAPFAYCRSLYWMLRYYRMRTTLRGELHAAGAALRQKEPEIPLRKGDALWRRSVALFSAQLGVAERTAEYFLDRYIYRTWIRAVRDVPLRAGMRSLIGFLHREKIPMGILSDFRVREKLAQWGISRYFSAIVCSEDYGVLKPDPRIFRLCCQMLGSDPARTVYVGNSLTADAIGSYEAGLIPALFYGKKRAVEKDYGIPVVKSVAQLEHFLASLKLPRRS